MDEGMARICEIRNYDMKTIPVHINKIQIGDTVLHNDKTMTVCNSDLKSDLFIGRTLFGDSYCMGYKPVMKVVFDTPKIPLKV
jgi:hypothetical protein